MFVYQVRNARWGCECPLSVSSGSHPSLRTTLREWWWTTYRYMCAYVTHIRVHIATDTWSTAPLCVLQPSHEEVALKDLQMSPDSYLKSETQALIQQTPSTCSFSSPLTRPSDRLEPSGPPLKHSHSRESVCSLRRASSLHDIDGMRDQWSGMSVCACTHLVPSVNNILSQT